jgi:hypothetical protein
MKTINEQEFVKITKTFLNRLKDSMCTASCNDLFEDEFPKSICDKFNNDNELFNTWKKLLYHKLLTRY